MTQLGRAGSARGEIVLRQRPDGHLELRANGVFVMDTLEHTSERALATEALRHAGARPLRVLVGGLGLGFTLAAALADDRVTRCTVVEIEPALVGWLRNGTVPHGPAMLADPRVEVVVDDVADVLRSVAASSYDLVLLDVDNGPGYLVHDANAALYAGSGLADARAALADDGMLVVWSASPAPDLEAALREVFGNAEENRYAVPGHGRAGDYFLYSARR
ncbi:hypothetical protein [Nocardioides antri]|uniref:Spermidine synthase n=1 Tax=Nocardioides antri TaxID=2607659 RepID=A0A5B1M3J9_9ACTN|nr:hypothetical protein [Nocardioides antri]KAA1427354.1 hypothetical protein F0U47_07675 [Nocardioides antri]